MLFQVNESTEITGFGGLAGPQSHFYPVVEVASRCHLFHLYMATFDAANCLHINRHFISTQIEPVLELIKDDQVESASIFIQRLLAEKTVEGTAKLDLIQEIYKLRTESESTHIYLLKNKEEVFDCFHNVTGKTTKKILVYRNGDSSFFANSEAENK